MLESRPPFAPLRLLGLALAVVQRTVTLPAALLHALADVRLQPELSRLELSQIELREHSVMDALADAVVARQRLRHLSINSCALVPAAAAPALARMLCDGALTSLEFFESTAFEDATAIRVLRDALRANSALTSLSLRGVHDPAAPMVRAVLGAVVGHRSLSKLDLGFTFLDQDPAVGTALAALLIADAPALTELHLVSCRLGEAGLGPLCDALQCNRHLSMLDIRGNELPAGFMRARLLPAVRANTGLLTLVATGETKNIDDDVAAAREAQRIVAAR